MMKSIIKIIIISSLHLFLNCSSSNKNNQQIGALVWLVNQPVASVVETTNCVSADSNNNYNLVDTIISPLGLTSSDSNSIKSGICGGGQYAGSTDVYSMSSSGDKAVLILRWKDKKVINTTGKDFIIYENPFQVEGTTNYFIEPIVVEVSLNGTDYCGFNPQYTGTANPATLDRTPWLRFAGLNPVTLNTFTKNIPFSEIFNNPILPQGGGDAFDLDDLSCSNSTLETNLKNNGFVFLKLTTAKFYNVNLPSITGVVGGPDIDGVVAKSLITSP